MIQIDEALSKAINKIGTEVVDLICIANIDISKSIVDEAVTDINGNIITITGLMDSDLVGSPVVMGEEIATVLSIARDVPNNKTDVTLSRYKYGTSQSDLSVVGLHFRRVVIFDKIKSYKLTDRIGDMKQVFPCEVSSGSLSIYDDVSNWSVFSDTKKYFLRKKQSPVYIFKGTTSDMVLKYTYFTDGKVDKTAVKNRQATIDIKLKSKLNLWYNEKIKINQQIKNTTPKEFFSIIFDEPQYNIYYSNGNIESDFLEVNNIHTKEYDTFSSILKAYCSTSVRFTFDRLEKIKVFTDIVVDNIVSNKTIEVDIFDIKTDSTNQIIYNSINTNIDEKLPIYNFEDLGNKYVSYAEVLPTTFPVSTLFALDGNGDYQSVPIDIISEDMSKIMQIGDYATWRYTSAVLGRTVEFMLFAIGKFTNSNGDSIVRLYPAIEDKDKALYFRGKLDRVIVPLINESANGNILFGRVELPTVWKYTRSLESGEATFNLKYPVLPKVDEVEQIGNYPLYATMGTTKNLKIGEYAGYCEEIDSIYGSWTGGTELLYFNETFQFDDTKPPIGLLSNRIDDTSTNILKYETFDNSDIKLSVSRPQDGVGDAVIELRSDISVSEAELIEDIPISMVGNRILEVQYADDYKLGDVLIVKKPDPLIDSNLDVKLYDETLYRIKWSIIAIDDTGTQKFIYLDSDFPSDFTFIKFPRASIIHLQELYILGNPVIRYSSEVGATSTDLDPYGYLSNDLWGTQNYNMSSTGMTDTYDSKILIGYILDNYNGVLTDKTKFLLPVEVSLRNFNLELLDVVEINEPVFTKIGLGTKWLIVSEEFMDSKSGIKIKYMMQNLNSENAIPFDIDISEVLTYEPVELPTYDSGGKEGDPGDGQDGEGINKKDEAIGEVWLSEVSPTEFVGKVYDFDNLGDVITLYDFGGTLVNEYLGVFFNDEEYIEFGLKIEDEIFFVKNILKDVGGNYRCEILRRQLYNTPRMVDISNNNKDKKVTFYVVSTQTKSDGTFYARRVHIGDGDTYFRFHPISGAVFQGDFLVKGTGENIGDEVLSIQDGNITLNGNTIVTGDFKVVGENITLDGDTTITGAFQVVGSTIRLTGDTVVDGSFKVTGDTIELTGNTIIDGTFKVSGGTVILDGDTDVNGTLEVYRKDASSYGIKVYDGVDLANSNNYVQLIDGGIDLYERGIGGLFYKTRGIRKFVEGTAVNNEIVDLKNNVTYGTKTDWLDTVSVTYLKDKIFGQNRGISMWTDVEKINDNQFRAKVYETYLNILYADSLSTIDEGSVPNQTSTYQTTARSGTDFNFIFTGTMKPQPIDSFVSYVVEDLTGFVKLEIFKNSVLHATRIKNYAGDVQDTSFTLSFDDSFQSDASMYAKVTFYNGRYDLSSIPLPALPNFNDLPLWINGDLLQDVYQKTTVENNLSAVYFESNEK